MKKIAIGLLIFFGFLSLISALFSGGSKRESVNTAAPVASVASSAGGASKVVTQEKAAQSWEVEEHKDEMTGKTRKIFYLISSESMNLKFPYNGRNMGHLFVRFPEKGKPEAFFALDKGNFVCSPSDCSVLVKFDDHQPQKFTMHEPDDHSANALFFDNAGRFIESARKANKILIEVRFFDQGRQIIRFASDKPLP